MAHVPGPAPRMSGSALTTSSASDVAAATLEMLNSSLVAPCRARTRTTAAAAVMTTTVMTGGRK
jgi:hypothetical protein